MKLVSIEIAEAVEKAIVGFLEEKGESESMRFTRFIDLGGKQVELFLYPPEKGTTVWCTIAIKSVFKTDEGDCVVSTVRIPSLEKKFEDVMVNPVEEKLPAMVERVLNFLKEDLLRKASEKGTALEGGGLALESEDKGVAEPESGDSGPEDETPLSEISEKTGEKEDSTEEESESPKKEGS